MLKPCLVLCACLFPLSVRAEGLTCFFLHPYLSVRMITGGAELGIKDDAFGPEFIETIRSRGLDGEGRTVLEFGALGEERESLTFVRDDNGTSPGSETRFPYSAWFTPREGRVRRGACFGAEVPAALPEAPRG